MEIVEDTHTQGLEIVFQKYSGIHKQKLFAISSAFPFNQFAKLNLI